MSQSTEGSEGPAEPPVYLPLLMSVSSALQERAGKSVFAIGGKIDPLNPSSSDTPGKAPLVIRWDSPIRDRCSKVVLPVKDDRASQSSFARLIKDCEPASFGKGKEAAYDEEYRKATELDGAKFSINFNPYEHGIIDTVVQALAHGGHTDSANHGIRADLYKLNLYSAPSGKFKSHVDTPRSEMQMGSLVVCLPYEHQGGQLAVRHGGRKVVFDWATQSASSIQWAAFFSDCEHEVFEVTEGHRLTLTYNLFWTPYGPSMMATRLDSIEQQNLHFFKALEKLLETPEFLSDGGTIGFTCTHAYPHSSEASMHNLHHTLKGLDMVVYQTLQRLVGNVHIAAMIKDNEEYYPEGLGRYDSDAICEHDESRPYLSKGLEPVVFYDEYDYEMETLNPGMVEFWHAGRSHKIYPRHRDVTWLNYLPGSKTHQELSVVYMAYGNSPCLESFYSSAVIIAQVSPLESSSGEE